MRDLLRTPAALMVVVGLLLAGSVSAQDKLSQNALDPRFDDTPIITDPFDFSVGGFLVDLNTSAAIGGGVASTDITVAYNGDDPYRVDYRYSGVLFHLRGSF